GGVFGVAVLASVFAHAGGYRTALTFTNGTSTAVYIGAGVVALAAGLIRQRPVSTVAVETDLAAVPPVREAAA
ncbi:MAG: MFS transporter, partial [Gaiellaceae bacterium]